MKSGGATIQRGRHALSRKAKVQNRFSIISLRTTPFPNINYRGIMVTGVAYYMQAWVIEKRRPVFPAMWNLPNFIIAATGFILLLGEPLRLGRFQEIVPLNAGDVLGIEDNGLARKWLALTRKTPNNLPGSSGGEDDEMGDQAMDYDEPDYLYFL